MVIVSRCTRYCVFPRPGPCFTSTAVITFYINLIVQVDNNGVFKSVFVVHYAAVAVVRAHGRPVCSTDFGHFKHDYFDGLNATGLCL